MSNGPWLNAEDRDLIESFIADGFSNEEIVRLIGCHRNTVSRVRRAATHTQPSDAVGARRSSAGVPHGEGKRMNAAESVGLTDMEHFHALAERDRAEVVALGERVGTRSEKPVAERTLEGSQIHDGAVPFLAGCPRGLTDCVATARRASPGYESFMCCGETETSAVPTDVLRLCIKSSHHRKPVDLLVNLDRRDAIEVAAVLLAGMSTLAQLDAANAFAIAEGAMPEPGAALSRESPND